MKNNKLTVAQSYLGEGSYVSPAVAVSEISNEGVLCVSTNGSHESWGEEDLW